MKTIKKIFIINWSRQSKEIKRHMEFLSIHSLIKRKQYISKTYNGFIRNKISTYKYVPREYEIK